MSDCRFGVSPVKYPDSDPDSFIAGYQDHTDKLFQTDIFVFCIRQIRQLCIIEETKDQNCDIYRPCFYSKYRNGLYPLPFLLKTGSAKLEIRSEVNKEQYKGRTSKNKSLHQTPTKHPMEKKETNKQVVVCTIT